MAERRLQALLGHLRPEGGSPTAAPVSGASLLRYTVAGNGVLSEQQREAYEKDGYLVVPGLVSGEDLKTYTERFENLCTGVDKTPGLTIMKDVSIAKSEFKTNERAVTKIQNFQHDPVLSGYFSQPAILRYVECFTGPDIMAMHTMLINKPPDPGLLSSRHPMHQDLHYFPFRPADRIVCSWTAMEHVHRGNGCLVVLPGSHTGTLQPHDYPKWEGGVNKMYHGIQNYDPSMPRHHLEMQAGDTVFFHPLLIHGSGTNRTTGFRKAISCHFASSHCEYVDVEGTSQHNIAEEIEELARKRLGPDIKFTFQDTWKLRGVCVQGQRGTLGGYVELSESEWRALPSSYSHAAHVMVYAPWPGSFLDKYQYKYAVSMQLRFDGTLGFAGGLVDAEESPEQAASRELAEETGYSGVVLHSADHVITQASETTKFCLHFFAKPLTLEQLVAMECSVVTSSCWGEEVLGVIRVPLYSLPNGLGLPAFLRHQFIGSSRQQLLVAIERCGLLEKAELRKAVQLADNSDINTFVTRDEINY